MTNELPRRVRDWFQQSVEKNPASQSDLARSLGISPSAVTRILKGERQISLSEFTDAIRYFGSEAEVFELLGLDETRRNRQYPKSYRHHITSGPVVISSIGGPPPDWEIPRLCVGLPNEEALKWFYVEDDNMSPTIREKDAVFLDTSIINPSRPGIYVIDNEFGELVVRRLDRGSAGEGGGTYIRVGSDNSQYRSYEVPLSALKVHGRCFAIYRRGF